MCEWTNTPDMLIIMGMMAGLQIFILLWQIFRD